MIAFINVLVGIMSPQGELPNIAVADGFSRRHGGVLVKVFN